MKKVTVKRISARLPVTMRKLEAYEIYFYGEHFATVSDINEKNEIVKMLENRKEETMSEFKITLKAARVNADRLLWEVADIVGIHAQKLTHYERGRIPVPENLMQELSKLYGVPRKHLLDEQPRKDF